MGTPISSEKIALLRAAIMAILEARANTDVKTEALILLARGEPEYDLHDLLKFAPKEPTPLPSHKQHAKTPKQRAPGLRVPPQRLRRIRK